MESGSLLPEALERMERLRRCEFGGRFDDDDDGEDDDGEGQVDDGGGILDDDGDVTFGGGGTDVGRPDLPRNALVASLYLLDDPDDDDDEGGGGGGGAKNVEGEGEEEEEEERRRVRRLRLLARAGRIANSSLLPLYRRRFAYPWLTGGDGPAFGARARSAEGAPTPTPTPHLRAVVRYGHSVMDEWAAIALTWKLTVDLRSDHGIGVAAEVWDADDGHVLLIEAAEHLPGWVEELGADGCRHRCWIADGRVHLIPPDDGAGRGGRCEFGREDALRALARSIAQDGGSRTEAPIGVRRAIGRRIGPFLEAWRSDRAASSRVSKRGGSERRRPRGRRRREAARTPGGLKEHLHRCALVLPLKLARIVEGRPELVGAAVLAFCRFEGDARRRSELKTKPREPTEASRTSSAAESTETSITFERLVFAVVTLTRTSYALLMTGAGLVPSPYPIPREYKSVELRQIRRKCQTGGMRERLRYSLEGGVRLCRGFEFLLRGDGDGGGGKGKGKAPASGAETARGAADGPSPSSDAERRLRGWMDVDARSGGSGSWIRRAWTSGPNATPPSRSIDDLLSCPLYHPEITKGGICPLSHPGHSPGRMVRDALRKAEREGELGSDEVGRRFGVPREDEVDGDGWLDVRSGDAFDRLLRAAVGASTAGGDAREDGGAVGGPVAAAATPAAATPAPDADVEDEDEDEDKDKDDPVRAVDGVLSGLKRFVEAESGAEGIENVGVVAPEPEDDDAPIGPTGGSSPPPAAPPKEEEEVPWWDRDDSGSGSPDVDPRAFLRILHWTLTGEGGDDNPPWLNEEDRDGGKTGARAKAPPPGVDNNDDDFFGSEDYDAFEPDSDEDSDEGGEGVTSSAADGGSAADGSTEEEEEPSMADFMSAMDRELRGTNVERGAAVASGGAADDDEGEGDIGTLPRMNPDDTAAADVAVLTNLLESLDAQGGGPGPASNLLGGMMGRRPRGGGAPGR